MPVDGIGQARRGRYSHDSHQGSELLLYPNPSNGLLTAQWQQEGYSFQLIIMWGATGFVSCNAPSNISEYDKDI
ncbi:MAG: hypothetical protein H6573_11410 [Lewinellaceae bacterium]|nr:hypothetical protein [Lewinellaceae bacterium]